MSEVSCRAFSFLKVGERLGLLDVEQLLEGVPISRRFLENPKNRVSWDLWVSIVSRISTQLGSREAVISFGSCSVNREFAGVRFSHVITGALAGSTDMYRGVWRYVVPNNYRCIRTEVSVADGEVRLIATLKSGYQDCENWFLTTLGALPKLPNLLNQEDSQVLESMATPRRLEILLRPPQSKALFTRARRLIRVVASPTALLGELDFQQEQLTKSYDLMKRSERDFRAAFDRMPTLVIFHREGVLLYANPTMCEKIGYEPGALVGSVLTTLVCDEDHDQLSFLDNPGNSETVGFSFRHKDGTKISVEARSESGLIHEGLECTAIYATDVSARNRAQETVQALIQSSHDLIVRTDVSGELLDVQGGLGFELRAGRNFMPSKSVEVFLARIPGVSFDLAIIAWKVMEESLSLGNRCSYVIEAQGNRFYDCQISPYSSGAGLITIRDITELRVRERQLATADRLISLGTLVAGVGHEINNPLAYVLANAQILQDEFEGDACDESFSHAELAEISSEIVEGAERVTKIVESLRLFSRVTPAEVEEVNVEEVLARALRLSSAQFPPGVVVEQVLNSPPVVMADGAKLEQVFVNLFVNAAQACRDSSDKPKISVKTVSRDGETEVSISDNGVGVAPDDLLRIFDAFYTTKSVGEGIGLGLSIAHRIVESFGGSIGVTSEPGHGACFTVTLPS